MAQVIQAKTLSLGDLKQKFNLRLAKDRQFFHEWSDRLPELSDSEKQYLDRVKANYDSLLEYLPLSENIVKMVVLSPLLDLAGFYRPPYQVKTEAPVKIAVLFALLRLGNELYRILQVLKRLGTVLLEPDNIH